MPLDPLSAISGLLSVPFLIWFLWEVRRKRLGLPRRRMEPWDADKFFVGRLGQPYDAVEWLGYFGWCWYFADTAPPGVDGLAIAVATWISSRATALCLLGMVRLPGAVIRVVCRLARALCGLWYWRQSPAPECSHTEAPEAGNLPQHAHYSLQEYLRGRAPSGQGR